MSRRDIALDLYNSFKNGRKSFVNKERKEITRDSGEPIPVGDLINELISQREWKNELSEGEIFVHWQKIVGTEIAAHCQPIETKNKTLFIQCTSTAWATQLNLIKLQLLESIKEIAPMVEGLEIFGPNQPSWRKGLRTVQGFKGPRDTYG